MKARTFLIIFSFSCFLGCKTQKIPQDNIWQNQQGIYKQKWSRNKLELKSDGTYILYNPPLGFCLLLEQCEYASKGKWGLLSNDVVEITSENYYRQQGFKYELKKENKFSRDSLYIKFNLPEDFLLYRGDDAVTFQILINHKSIRTNNALTIIPKLKYLQAETSDSVNRNNFDFYFYKNGSDYFRLFKEAIDTKKSNYLTITLPNFDLCFFDFELYKQELIFIKKKNKLIWQGESWERM